eukprot:gene5975-9974_t
MEKEALKKEVEASPHDLDKWMMYVKSVVQEGHTSEIRKSYEGILSEFPLLYGYWKQYADFEASKSGITKALAVYERAIEAVPTSVDLWVFYCQFFIEKSQKKENQAEEVRELLERGIKKVGHDFYSQDIWNKYLEFEYSHGKYENVTKLYRRILKEPVRDLEKFWDAFKTHSLTRPVEELIATQEEELEELQKLNSEDEKRKLILQSCEKIFLNTKKLLDERKNFEYSILRSYFHTQALDNGQLETWRDYLEFEQKEKNHERILNLFERCLVPCALYFEFWKRYILYLEKMNLIDEIRKIYEKITKIHLKRNPIVFIDYAEFEESQGNIEKSRDIFKSLLKTCGKGHIESIMRFAYFEKRQKKTQESLSLFVENLQFISNDSISFYHIVHAQFALILNEIEQTRQIYKKYSEKEKSSNFWISYAEFEIKQKSNQNEIISIFEKALNFVKDQKKILSRYSEYLLMIDSPKFRDIESRLILSKLYHPQLLKPQIPDSMINKKPKEDTMQWYYQQEKHNNSFQQE